jgi:phosphoribosylanthranilate isomerase
MWVKICGNTNLEDALLAVDAGADALGFVLAPSPRRVSLEEVATISARLPQDVERYGVFVEPTFDELVAAVDATGLNGVQLHVSTDATLPRRLRERFGPGLRIFRATHYQETGLAETLAAAGNDPALGGVLIDSRTPEAVGGTGTRFNWAAAAQQIGDRGLRFVVAGGLTPENVAEAVATLRPAGVDVVSGVEASPGRKDADKVRRFVAAARAAASRR